MSDKKNHVSSKIKIRLLDEKTPFAIKEAFNHLRANLMYSPKKGDGCPVFATTSAEAGVGKSTVIANLAISFAKCDKKVLLVDADMRRPVLYKHFGYNKKHTGLSELLSGIITDDKEALCNPCPSLDLITSGCVPPNPSELINGKVFKDFITKWKHEYDIVLIDLPPVGVVSDCLSIVHDVDGYVIITMANKSDARRVNAAIATLKHVDGKIIGLVVNGTSLKGNIYGRYRTKYGYDYYYGIPQD